ncbi:MAG: N-acetylmuramoyl-L-alanine amidase [Bacteroidales bacterium]|nr:N-acetylmuramoyl-L-alanine amidase [Bacteroidales bacterium]
MLRFFRILTILTIFALALPLQLIAKEQFTIIIDPGHGGGDYGTPHRKCKQDEKTIALNVALKLGKLIEKNYSDVKVVYTRKTDKYPSLPERTQIAKKNKGDLFISIHVNACPTPSVRGFETYIFGTEGSDSGKRRVEERLVEERENLDISGKRVNFDTDIDIETKILCQAQREKHNKQSQEIAQAVHKNLIASLKKTSYAKNVVSRGVKAKNLFVLCYSPMPAILVELGYMSNVAEERFINTDEAQSTFANALYQGFKEYKRKWDKRQLSNQDNAKPDQQKDNAKPAEQDKPKPSDQSTNDTPKQQATGNVVWKIQFLTSSKLLNEGSPEFKGLNPVSYYKEGDLYKYTYGSAPTSRGLNAELKKVTALFPGAFPVKFDANGNRIKN